MSWQVAIPIINDGKTFATLAVPAGLVRTVLTVSSNNTAARGNLTSHPSVLQ